MQRSGGRAFPAEEPANAKTFPWNGGAVFEGQKEVECN
jgi:hypothetical protein